MHKGFLKIAAIAGMLSVLLGAFAAHALRDTVSERAISIFETAVLYQFYHVIALMVTGILYIAFPYKTIVWAGYFFIGGMLLFCGSLYALAVLQAMVMPGYKWLGPLTPIGGFCFIAGWLLLFISFFKKQQPTVFS